MAETKLDDGKELLSDADVYQNFDNKLKTQFKNPPSLYYITIGNKDPLKPFLDNYRKRLSKLGCTYLYRETDGAHSWENWRKYLLDFLPRIFNLNIMTMKEIIRKKLEAVLPLVDLDSDFLFRNLILLELQLF